MTQKKSLKRRVRARMAETGERYTEAREAVVGTRPEGRDAIVLKVNKVSARVRLVGEEGEVTFRTRDHWRLTT